MQPISPFEERLMNGSPMYNDGSRSLQDKFDSRRLADRLEEVTVHTVFSDDDRAFVERSPMFFLATADRDGRPDCSYKGGMPGFVRVVADDTLAFPDYDGNGMFRSLGNILVNPRVGLLFIDFSDRPFRMRVSGTATVHDDDPLLEEFPGAQMIVRVKAERIFPNCPRYIHHMRLEEYSVYAPQAGHEPPAPGWKKMPVFSEVLPGGGEQASRKDE
jgi:predicted pyridoxine 5'-phosphate oxidase superfamily flavin-nucleotide-binding protein